MKPQITVRIVGSKKDGYILTVLNQKEGFLWDVGLKESEILEIYKAIGKKLKLK